MPLHNSWLRGRCRACCRWFAVASQIFDDTPAEANVAIPLCQAAAALRIGMASAAAEASPYAGRQPVHRLNRAEYANAIRDLLGVEIDVKELLPSDGGDFGFDNIAAVLTTSPLLRERYLTAALRVADAAVGNPDAVPTNAAYKIPVDLTQEEHLEGLPLGTRGGIDFHVPKRPEIALLFLAPAEHPGQCMKQSFLGGTLFGLASPAVALGELQDFPSFWKDKKLTIEVEAKAKESAVLKLMNELALSCC